MFNQHLHIISFDVPYPANYGGIIDVFYKAKALSDYGVKIHLHCFQYGREQSPFLESIFYSVDYYKRDISKKNLFKRYPYIVETRHSEELVARLLEDDFPILMEGMHTSLLLLEKRLEGRKMLVRTHNVEHDYYLNLSKAESDPFKKYYYYTEAGKLKKYEKLLSKASGLIAISPNDYRYFSKRFSRVFYVPAFHPFTKSDSLTGKGNYVLYHGNLSVAENENVVRFLVRNVFSTLDYPVIIAGLNPSRALQKLTAALPHVTLIANPDDRHLKKLIQEAHVNILITGQATGMKLKLLNSMFNGRFCLINNKMKTGSPLDDYCAIANDANGIKKKIRELMEQPFTLAMKEAREDALFALYNNGDHVMKLLEIIA